MIELDRNQICRLLDNGKNVKEISTRLHVSVEVVKDYVCDNDLANHVKNRSFFYWLPEEVEQLQEEIANETSLTDIARAHGRSEKAVWCYVKKVLQMDVPYLFAQKKGPKEWRPEDVELLIEMGKQQRSLRDISAHFGLQAKAIKGKWAKLRKEHEGLPPLGKMSKRPPGAIHPSKKKQLTQSLSTTSSTDAQ